MVKAQVVDIIDLILQLVGHQNGVHRPCRNRKSRGAVLSTSEGQWATTKFDGVWKKRELSVLKLGFFAHPPKKVYSGDHAMGTS